MVELDTKLDLSVFKNVKITGIDVDALTDNEDEHNKTLAEVLLIDIFKRFENDKFYVKIIIKKTTLMRGETFL